MDLSPRMTAGIDQARARLAGAVGIVREHRQTCSIPANVCVGPDIWTSILKATRPSLEALLALALCTLAAQAVDPFAAGGIDRLLAELDQEGTG